jgi:hypothetical protein
MSAPLKKLVLTPVIVSAAVFATLTLPLAFFGKKPVTIQLSEEPIFNGQLRDIAAPYLGLASILSLGAGCASVAITGWRNSTRKSSQVEAQLSNLAQNLREKEAQLEALKLSESQLEAAGLSAFLDEPLQQESAKSPVVERIEPPQQELVKPPIVDKIESSSKVEAVVITAQPLAAQPIMQAAHARRTVQAVAGLFSTAQPFLGYARTPAKISSQPAATVTQLAPLDVSLDVRELHTKLEQIRAQMATLQNAIASSAPSASIETQPARQTLDETTTVATHLQVVNWSVNQKSS